jgi:regulator of replication initiation timing
MLKKKGPIMVFPEELIKRVETLIRAVKLLGEEYQEQKTQINKFQEELTELRIEMTDLKKKLSQRPLPAESTISRPEKVSEIAKESSITLEIPQEKSEPLLVAELSKQKLDFRSPEQDSDKRDLLEALKIIDNL